MSHCCRSYGYSWKLRNVSVKHRRNRYSLGLIKSFFQQSTRGWREKKKEKLRVETNGVLLVKKCLANIRLEMGDGWLARGDCIKEARERKISGNVCRRVVARSCAGISLVRESSALMRLIIVELSGLSLSLSLPPSLPLFVFVLISRRRNARSNRFVKQREKRKIVTNNRTYRSMVSTRDALISRETR